MTVALKKQLDESRRDAMLAYFLHNVIPNNDATRNIGIKSAQDLYDYWLLDVLVSQDVPTTTVACAIASLQQYINRILMNLEPGYDKVTSMPERTRTWHEALSQYSTWSAFQRLLCFPSSYLDPELRTFKSDNFRQLESDLSQNRIQTDAVRVSVLAYLTRLEVITNLNILNGYIDSEDFAESNYYLLGKSRSENSYFWCSLDMAARPVVTPPVGSAAVQAKQDQPAPHAWSQWQKADIPISDSAIEHTIRPVWFNNRLFIIWAELITQNRGVDQAAQTETAAANRHSLLRLNFSFRRHDGHWSAVQTPIQDHIEADSAASASVASLKKKVGTIAINHKSKDQDFLFISLQVKASADDSKAPTFCKNVYMDRNLSIELDDCQNDATLPFDRNLLLADRTEKLLKTIEPRPFQHRMHIPKKFKLIHNPIYHSPSISPQIRRLQSLILQPNEKLEDETLTLTFQPSEISENLLGGLTRTLSFKFGSADMTLVFASELPSNPFMPLLSGSTLTHPKLVPTHLYILEISQPKLTTGIRASNLNFALKDRINALNFTHETSGELDTKLISTDALKELINAAENPTRSITVEIKIFGGNRQDRIESSRPDSFSLTHKLNVEFVVAESSTATSIHFTEIKKTIELSPLPQSSFDCTWKAPDLVSTKTFIHYGFNVTPGNGSPLFIGKSIEVADITKQKTPPVIKTTSNPDLAQFIDFSGSSIASSDDKQSQRQSIRVTTAFAAELIKRTENSLDELFSIETQRLLEPAVEGESAQNLDFHGPFGRYFTELFLYLPWLVAHRLNVEEQYDAAQQWLNRVFSPRDRTTGYWGATPLLDSDAPIAFLDQAPHDPHQIALIQPVHFRKALYFLYVDILINRGDAAFRERTSGSLAQAKLWYMQTLELLGQRPAIELIDQWTPISLRKLSEVSNKKLRRLEPLVDSASSTAIASAEDSSTVFCCTVDNPRWRMPFHPHLLKRWDIVESRLHNLRHHLDIAGRPLHIPLHAPAGNPRELLQARASTNTRTSTNTGQEVQIPHYRFSAMYVQALNAVEAVIQSGNLLLSLIERREQAHLQEMQQEQLWRLATTTVELHTQAIQADSANREALQAGKAIVQKRLEHYRQLLDQDVSANESAAGELHLQSGTFEKLASSSQVVAGGIMLLPNIIGTSFGGSRLEGAAHAASALMQVCASNARTQAGQLDRSAQFQRRREDWLLAHEQAELEISQIDKQLQHLSQVQKGTRLQLRQAETTLSQARAVHDFFGKRFSQAQMYQWLNSQFSAMYFQAYDATLALCRETEACWRYETADFDRYFFQRNVWNASCRGLGAGEQLKVNLLQMQAGYVQRHQRDLEIRKTLSLRTLKQQDANSLTNKTWDEIKTELQSGKCEFEMTHTMFESDYAGQLHYLRRIKTISISLPAVLGPYDNVRAILPQTSSEVHLDRASPPKSIKDLRVNQQIALSGGIDDSGMFTLNFNDERYLPFEYTGAISKWCLTFPNPQGQKQLLDSLNDIIVHVCYTARAGAAS